MNELRIMDREKPHYKDILIRDFKSENYLGATDEDIRLSLLRRTPWDDIIDSLVRPPWGNEENVGKEYRDHIPDFRCQLFRGAPTDIEFNKLMRWAGNFVNVRYEEGRLWADLTLMHVPAAMELKSRFHEAKPNVTIMKMQVENREKGRGQLKDAYLAQGFGFIVPEKEPEQGLPF